MNTEVFDEYYQNLIEDQEKEKGAKLLKLLQSVALAGAVGSIVYVAGLRKGYARGVINGKAEGYKQGIADFAEEIKKAVIGE